MNNHLENSSTDELDNQIKNGNSIETNNLIETSNSLFKNDDNDLTNDVNSIDSVKKKNLSEERINLMRVVNTFKDYADHSKKLLTKKLDYFESLSNVHKKYLEEYKESLQFQIKCVDINYEVIKRIATDIDIFENDTFDEDELKLLKSKEIDLRPEPHYHDKIHSILKQIVREWAPEGEEERRASFDPILRELDNRFKGCKASEIKILVPGAGLGRLTFEIARRGYQCQGNEYSLFMLFTSNFILNKGLNAFQLTIYPYLHCNVNNYSVYDQVRGIRFPDINLAGIETNLSMVGGNFIEIYEIPNSYHCICTCFFIDTTHNVLDYVEKIYSILKYGGIWINLGPLLYHYGDKIDSIEPSYDVLKKAIKKFGFVFLKEQTHLPMYYTQNSSSMLLHSYKSVFLFAKNRKKFMKISKF